jgi:hypothetical protein
MLRNLSYLNLAGTVCYFLVYLQNGSRIVILGLLAAIVYQWLSLRSQEQGGGRMTPLQGLFAAITLVFALYLGFGAFSLLLSMIEYQYYPWSSILLVGSGILLVSGLLFHLFLSWSVNSVKKDE